MVTTFPGFCLAGKTTSKHKFVEYIRYLIIDCMEKKAEAGKDRREKNDKSSAQNRTFATTLLI